MKIQSVTSLIFLLIFSVVTIAFLPHSFLPKRIQRTTPSPFKTPNDDFLIPQISQSFLRRNQGQSSSTALFGIPKLFRWLVDLYPIVVESVGDVDQNSLQIDNFYLDMNGIIHSCTHSNEGELIALDEKQMFLKIFDYTDRLFQLVKPKRLMFLAIDGVAPRAKMNQQRSRRYRASKEREALIAQYVAKEGKLPETDSFDSNCITPGTDFMHRLSVAFRAWIEYKMKSDASWQTGVEVIFSGPDVPGEGEHKVMDQIRFEQEHDPDYRAKRYRHCMYGLDADLIMLGLVTHEPHFVLLREKILRGGTTATQRAKSTGKKSFAPEDFEILELSILRTMLTQYFSKRNDDMGKWIKQKLTSVEKNYAGIVDGPTNTGERGSAKEEEVSTSSSKLSKKSPSDDIERLIDDFVFMCYFVGNDFLPCIPHLDIADGALNYMMNLYKQLFPTMGGYLTNKHQIHLPRLELFLQEIARREPLYFQQRSMDENEKQYATPEYKDHYYKLKFGFTADNSTAKRQVVQSYMEGLFWVLTYYHYGCASWTWYYPYLYGPLASDLTNLSSLSFQFEKGRPFTPLLQLLSVLPPQSGKLLPSSYSKYMVDESSPLSRFYPRDFEVDANGKKNSWECVVQIPFIEEEVLVNTISQIDHRSDLSKSERIRNLPGNTHQYKITPKEEVDKEEGMKEKGEKGGEKRKKKGVTNNNTASSSSAAAASSTTAPSTSSPHKFKNALIDDRKRHHQ